MVPRIVIDKMNEELVKEVRDEEIMQTVFNIGALRAPRPDNFNEVSINNIGGLLRRLWLKR